MTFYTIISSCIIILIAIMWIFPHMILPILVFLVPLQRYSIYLDKFGFSLKFIIIFIPIVTIIILLKRRFFKLTSIFNNKKFHLYSVLLLVGIFFSFLRSINPARTLLFLFYIFLLIIFILLINLLIQNKKKYWKIIYYFLLSGTVVSAVSIIQFFLFRLGKNILLPFEKFFSAKTITAQSFVYSIGTVEYLRPSSTFIDANITAGFLTVVVLLSLAYLIYWFRKGRKKSILLYGFLFIFNVIAYSMTVSRSAFLGIFFALIIFIIINLEYLKNKNLLYFIGLFLILAVLLNTLLDTPIDAFCKRLITTFYQQDGTGSTQEHIRFSIGAWKTFLNNPLSGVGAGNFEEYYLSNIDPLEDTAYSYNIYLSFLAETGLIGFLTQITFIAFVIRSSLLTIKNLIVDSEKLLFSALFCGYIALLIANFFYAYYILFFVWLVIGLLIKGPELFIKKVE